MKNKVTGIILLAGNSTRYGKNKNFEELNGILVFLYSLKVFLENKNIDDIILVIRENDKDFINNIILNNKISDAVKLVLGGKTRQESVYNALINTDSDIVLIHDAARPLIKGEYIDNCIKALNEYDGAITGVKVKDTIKIVNDNLEISSSTKRTNTYISQTPQAFYRKLLLNLHEKYKDNLDITDDSMLLEKDNYKVKIVNGDYSNIKITTPDDYIYASQFIKKIRRNNE